MSGHLTDDCDTVSESDLRQVEYDYDDLNRLRYVRDWEAGTTYTQDGTSYDVGYSYDDGGRLTGMALPNGTSATMQYDADDFLDRIDYFDSQQQRLTFYDYEVNGVGLRTQMREPDMATCDALPGDANQLVSAINRCECKQ